MFSANPRFSWWRHQMQTFSPLLALYAGNSSVTGEFPSFDVFFDVHFHDWQRTRHTDLWCYFCLNKLQTVELALICDALTLMWHPPNTESCRTWSITIVVKPEWMSSMLRVTLQWAIECATFVSWWHWTYKVPVRLHFVECVSKIKHIFSVIHYTIYGAVCFQFTHFPWDDWENIHFVLSSSSNRKYELLSIVRVRSWNNGMRCMSLYILTHSPLKNRLFIRGYFYDIRQIFVPSVCALVFETQLEEEMDTWSMLDCQLITER